MPTRNLDKMFYPRSVAVVGASNREGAPGHIVMHNLLHGGFEGPIMPVSAEDHAISGVLAYPRIEVLPETPDLAVVCGAWPLTSTLRALGERGTRAAILLNDGFDDARARRESVAEAGRVGLRLLGPDCLGVMVPGIGLNASTAPVPALPGGSRQPSAPPSSTGRASAISAFPTSSRSATSWTSILPTSSTTSATTR